MLVTYLISFNLGLFSSLHCVGMCGGILSAMMLAPSDGKHNIILNPFQRNLAYNLGRIMSYSFAGLLAGLLGAGIIGLSQPYNMHLALQIIASCVLFTLALRLVGLFPFQQIIEKLVMRLWNRIQPLGKALFPINTLWRALLFGMLWGWLPCGLVYSALLLSVSAGSPVSGFLTMLCFGIGTLPVMLGAGYFSGHLNRLKNQRNLKWATACLMIMIAISLPLSTVYFSAGHDHAEHHQHH